MAKLGIEIIGEKEPLSTLSQLAKQKFGADKIVEIEGSSTCNIDAGINNIRAKITAENTIEFYHRYAKDCERYESLTLAFCRENYLTLRFSKGGK
jgi:hypothetical protein